jgi:hypothetical protein
MCRRRFNSQLKKKPRASAPTAAAMVVITAPELDGPPGPHNSNARQAPVQVAGNNRVTKR